MSRCDWHRKQPEAESLMEGDGGGWDPEQGQEEDGTRSRDRRRMGPGAGTMMAVKEEADHPWGRRGTGVYRGSHLLSDLL